jgi:hypothetical protein
MRINEFILVIFKTNFYRSKVEKEWKMQEMWQKSRDFVYHMFEINFNFLTNVKNVKNVKNVPTLISKDK